LFRYDYKYRHKKIYKKIEFKIYYVINSNEESGVKPYLYYKKTINTLKLFDLSNLKVIPVLSDNTTQELTLSDPSKIKYNKLLIGINKDYSRYFCSEKYFVSFVVGNNNDDAVKFDIYNKNLSLKQEICDGKNVKEISLVVDSGIELNEFYLEWQMMKINKINGKTDLSQIFKEFCFKFRSSVSIINLKKILLD
jgi:hypothetical protein